MELILSDGRKIELHDASENAKIDFWEASRWAIQAVEETTKQVRAGEKHPHWYCTSGDTFVLALANEVNGDLACIDVWLFKVTEHGWVCIDGQPQPVAADLRSANTRPDSVFCVQCGTKLKDPGMGPAYKHCPVCEP